MKTNQKGFSVIEVVIVIVVVGLLGAVGWFVYDRQQNKTSETPNTQTSTTKKEETAKKTDPNEGYLVVKEWGLRFKTPTGLTDVRYTIHGDTVSFFAKPAGSSVQYRSDYEKFEDGNSRYAIGNLYRSTSSTKPFMDETREGKKVGDYYYYTSWAFSNLASGAGCVTLYGSNDQASCDAEGKAFQLVNQGDGALLNTIELAE